MKNFFKKENFAILADKKLLIAIVAVIFVPILYAGMFLWAFWDPYEHLADVPVAIVNEDEGYEFEDEYLELGNEFVDKMKEEPEFDFHFVDKNKGYQGLNDQEYYILIEIPKDFSKNASTVMDDTPQQLDLIYKPNESFNFLAAQIGETAMLQIEMALEEKITETYAETIFDKIDDVADGLVDASEATGDLNDGANELEDGSKKLQDNLITLASKTIEFDEGVTTAKDGSDDLATGANTLASGIYELYDNSNKLRNASVDLQSGAGQLASGINQADTGLQEMSKKVPQLVDGTKQVQGGLSTLHNQLPKEMAKQIDREIDKGTDTILDGTKELQTGITGGIEKGLKKEFAPELSKELTNGISKGIATEVVDTANDFISNAPTEIPKDVAKDIIELLKEKEAANKQELLKILKEANVPEEVINEVSKKLDEFQPNYDEIENSIISILEGILSEALDGVEITAEQEKQLTKLIKDNIESGITDGVNQGVDQAVDATVSEINSGFDQYTSEITKGLDGATKGLDKKIKSALDDPMNQLQGGLSTINTGQTALKDGVGQLANGTSQLKTGSSKLVTGQNSYVSNMNKFTSSFTKANDGTQTLAMGANTLSSGMVQLKDGSFQLNDGAHQLADGSEELYDGMNKLTDGTEEFNDKMNEAADEANNINATDLTHNMIANPVEVENEKIYEVPNYGTGFAPYFLSLGLFVGALLLSIVYPLREPSVVPTSGFSWFLRKFLGLFVIGILQAVIAASILLIGLGIEVQSIPLFYLYSIITSLVFITLIQFLVTCFDDPGRFVAILILILQLTTSAGTFPLELIPKALQPFNLLLPMTYSVAGYKAVISSGQYGVMWQNAGILLLYTLVFMLLTLSYFMVMYKRKFGNMGVNKEAKEV